MNDPSDQEDEIEIISESVSIDNNASKGINLAVKRKLRQQYPTLDMAGKKIRVVSSTGGVIDPSRIKITNVTRVPLKPVPVSSLRRFPGTRNNNASSNKENAPPGGPSKDQETRRPVVSSDFSPFSVSSDEEENSPGTPESGPGVLRSCQPSSLDRFSLSSKEDENPGRNCCDSQGSNNNNSRSGSKDSTEDSGSNPDLDSFHPLDSIKTRLVENNISSESFMNGCRDLNMNWIRLDVNWNVEISAAALSWAFGADIVERIISPAPFHNPSDNSDGDDLQSQIDKRNESGTEYHQQEGEDKTDARLEDVTLGIIANLEEDEGSVIADTLPSCGNEAGNIKDNVSDESDPREEEEESDVVSPPALYHRPRQAMMAMLGLVTHDQARTIREERENRVIPRPQRLRKRKPRMN